MIRIRRDRERTLLRLIEQQQQQIRDLQDRLMYLAGRAWAPPPGELTRVEDPPPVDWTATPEQEPVY